MQKTHSGQGSYLIATGADSLGMRISIPTKMVLLTVAAGLLVGLPLALFPGLLWGQAIDMELLTRMGALGATLTFASGIAYGFGSWLRQPIVHLANKKGTLVSSSFLAHTEEMRSLSETIQQMAHSLRSSTMTRDFLHGVVQSMGDALFVVDDQGKITLANRSASRLLGYTELELVDSPATHLFAYDEPLFGEKGRDLLMHRGHLFNMEREMRTETGEKIPVMLSCSSLAGGGMVMVAYDVREKRRVESELLRAFEGKQVVESANRAKSHFIATMSHELRTPLNAIIGYSELLMDEVDGEQAEDLTKIHTAGNRLLGLINDVLDLSKIEAGKMEVYIEDFDLEEMLMAVCEAVESSAFEKGVSVERKWDPPLGRMHSDSAKIRQCLMNLMINAVKFTEKGHVTLRCRIEHTEDREWIVFLVRDTGIGMSQEELATIFSDFSQADDSASRKYQGTGLGLSITRRLVRMLGGEINVESEKGKGTSFAIRMPRSLPG